MSWLRIHMAVLDAASVFVSFAANWLLQSTLLIVAGLAVARLLRHRGSALQSAVYRTTLATVIVCPLASGLLALTGVPGWSLPMPTAWTYEEPIAPAVIAAEPAGVAGSAAPQTAERSESQAMLFQRRPDGGPAETEVDLASEPQRVSPSYGRTEFAGRLGSVAGGVPARESAARSRAALTLAGPLGLFHVRVFGMAAIGMVLIWVSASAWLLGRLGRAWRRLNRLSEEAVPAEPAVQEICRELTALLEVPLPKVRRSPYLTSPCVIGRPRPTVLLPEAGPSLPPRDVLIHELAHLRRGDAGWNLLGRLAEALFFYQPLLWMLTRRLEAAAEEVCDDYVVQLGGDRSRYALGLVEIAEMATVPVGAAAVAMVSLKSILAKRVIRILDPSRSLSTRAGNFLLAVVIAGGLIGTLAAGFVGLGSRRSLADAQAPPENSAPDDSPDGKSNPQGEKRQPAPDNELRGVVTGADGKPVPGAKLYWLRSRGHDVQPPPPQLLASTGDDGKYHFAELPPVEPTMPASWDYWDWTVVVAPGHGFALARAATHRDSATILPAAGEPIRGQLVDVNGRPIVAAKVHIRWFNDAKDVWGAADAEARGVENARWQARVANLLDVSEPVQLRNVLPSATTDADGRFELRDIGQKRLVRLLVQGEGIEATEIVARNETGEKIVIHGDRHRGSGALAVYPNEFVCAVGPSKPVEGRVLDLDTGEPIAGAVVRAFDVHNEPISTSRGREHFAAMTDAQGRYRVAGLPVGRGNQLVAFGTGKVAYLPVAQAADTSADGAAIKLDFRLKRGVWAEGRVFDAERDRPLTGEISYAFFRNRELEKAIPGLSKAFVDGLYWTNANGEFRVPVLSSRGILAFRYDGDDRQRGGIDRFPRGSGADEIAGAEEFGVGKRFPTAPGYLVPEHYERLAEVAPAAGQATIRVDMPLFASPPATVRVEAMGAPVTKLEVYGIQPWGWQPHDGPEFTIENLRPGERRKVLAFHRGRNLAGGGFVEYGAKQTTRIELGEAGSVEGRLVEADGEPIDDATLQVNLEKLRSADNSAIWAPHPTLSANPTHIPVDKQGRFRLDGLIPGWTYHAYVSAPRPHEMHIGTAFTGVQVRAGEAKDLGDLVIRDDSRTTREAAAASGTGDTPTSKNDAAPSAGPIDFRGRVIGPHGKPAADARVFLMRFAHGLDKPDEELRIDSMTRPDGSFELRVPAEEAVGVNGWSVVATKKGYGPGWTGLGTSDQTSNLTLKLARDAGPVEGRVIDLEGRPVVGMKVEVLTVESFPDDDPHPYLDSLKKGERFQLAGWGLAADGPGDHRLIKAVQTDAQGNFKLYGIGQNRLAYVTLVGGGVENSMIEVLTHAVADGLKTQDPPPFTRHVYGPRFTHVARPSRTIVGIVTDAETDAPVAGAIVQSFPGWMSVVTGADGRFSLSGCPKADDYRLLASVSYSGLSGVGAYIGGSATVRDNRGLEPLEVKLHLYAAVPATGRVVDQATGRPVTAEVDYYPLYPNKHDAAGIASSGARAFGKYSAGHTDRDGRFSLAVLPGPGCLCIQAVNGERYEPAQVDVPAFLEQQGITVNLEAPTQAARLLRASGFPENKGVLFIGAGGGSAAAMQQSQFHAIALFNVAEDARKVVQDIELKLKTETQADGEGDR